MVCATFSRERARVPPDTRTLPTRAWFGTPRKPRCSCCARRTRWRVNWASWFIGSMEFLKIVQQRTLGSLDAQRRAHDTLLMSSDAAHTVMTGASGDIATVSTPASLADAQEAIPGLLDDIVVAHVLRTEHFDDLARLPAVSRAMRDAVAPTGLRFVELPEYTAAALGCLSAFQRLQRRGRLTRRDYFCQAAARVGNLEKLKEFRADDTPWGSTCWAAASGGHLKVLQWARANGCPWSEWTCSSAARGGHLEVLQWARANGCPWDQIRARIRWRADSWRCFSGRARTTARGAKTRACGRQGAATSRFSNGRARMAARGTRKRFVSRRVANTSKRCDG